MDEERIIKKYKDAQAYARRVAIHEEDKRDFPSWVIEKALSTKSRLETSFKLLFIDYLRETNGRKGSKFLESRRRIKHAGNFQDYENSTGSRRLDQGEIELDNSTWGDDKRHARINRNFDILDAKRNKVIIKQECSYDNILTKTKFKKACFLLYNKWNLTLKEIGEVFSLSEARICQIMKEMTHEYEKVFERLSNFSIEVKDMEFETMDMEDFNFE
jgi:DNA-directed RNA polymerase specialized sigma subunit